MIHVKVSRAVSGILEAHGKTLFHGNIKYYLHEVYIEVGRAMQLLHSGKRQRNQTLIIFTEA
jgi:hypothetical protein